MKNISRREAMETIIAGSAGLTLSTLTTAEAQTATPAAARAFAGQHQPKPLPFDAAKLKGISEKLIKSHWENNYGGAVKALNVVEQRLAAMLGDKDLPAYVYGDLKREELVRTGSVALHEHYFANLGGDGNAGGDALNAIKQNWGGPEPREPRITKTSNAPSHRPVLRHL